MNVLFFAPFSCLEPCFFCCRSQHESNVCLFCTKFCLNNRKVNLAITKTLKISCFENFPTLLYCDVLSSDEINFSVHSSSKGRKKSHCPNDFCEVISSPLTLWKFYLDIQARILLNCCDNFILPILLSGLGTDESINFVSDSKKIRETISLHAVKLSKRLAVYSCLTVNSDFIIKVFDTYKQGVDFLNSYFSIDLYQEQKDE